jgi:hypothetical protein
LIRKALPLLAAALLVSSFGSAFSQSPTDVPQTTFQKNIDRLDLGISGVGIFNNTVSGSVIPSAASNYNTPATQYGSNTFGALVTLRYIAKPYFGLEGNYGYARYTENFDNPSSALGLFQIQSKVTEYTLGYVVTPPHPIFGFQPFASVGAGSQAFRPTARGGEEEPEQARATYYYSLGLQQSYSNGHFGLRAGFRELFFLDPDFGQNYLTILKHATTYEPMIGIYFRY